MSKQNKALAEKIIDQLVSIDKHKVQSDAKVKRGEDVAYKDAYTARVLVLGYAATFTADTKKAARQEAVDYLASELDSGNLTLSDTWAEDNLE